MAGEPEAPVVKTSSIPGPKSLSLISDLSKIQVSIKLLITIKKMSIPKKKIFITLGIYSIFLLTSLLVYSKPDRLYFLPTMKARVAITLLMLMAIR